MEKVFRLRISASFLISALAVLAVLSQFLVAYGSIKDAERKRTSEVSRYLSSDVMFYSGQADHTDEQLNHGFEDSESLVEGLRQLFIDPTGMEDRLSAQLAEDGWETEVRIRMVLGRVVFEGVEDPELDGQILAGDTDPDWETHVHFSYYTSDRESGAEVIFQIHVENLTRAAIADAAPQLGTSAMVILLVMLAAFGVLRSLEARRELEQQKDILIDMLAHELNTPLTTIELVASTLRAKSEPATAQLAEALGRQSLRLRGLVRSALSTLDPRDAEADAALNPAITDAAAEARMVHPGRTVTVGEASEGARVGLAPEPLRTVLFNLLDNALKYSPDGTEVELRVYELAGEQTIAVGNVVSAEIAASLPDDLSDLTARLTRGAAGSQRSGLGLGLSVVARLLAGRGGELSLHRPLDGFRAEARLPRVS
jgi:signal transduction histidine kinase